MTENSSADAWGLKLGNMAQYEYGKAQFQRLVRPVSAYCKETYHNKNNKKR